MDITEMVLWTFLGVWLLGIDIWTVAVILGMLIILTKIQCPV